jgi:hypothetical protein
VPLLPLALLVLLLLDPELPQPAISPIAAKARRISPVRLMMILIPLPVVIRSLALGIRADSRRPSSARKLPYFSTKRSFYFRVCLTRPVGRRDVLGTPFCSAARLSAAPASRPRRAAQRPLERSRERARAAPPVARPSAGNRRTSAADRSSNADSPSHT